jgi:hypothetical protein
VKKEEIALKDQFNPSPQCFQCFCATINIIGEMSPFATMFLSNDIFFSIVIINIGLDNSK